MGSSAGLHEPIQTRKAERAGFETMRETREIRIFLEVAVQIAVQ